MEVRGLSTHFDRLLDEAERKPRDQRTPLMKAAGNGDVAKVRALIAKGADVDAKTAEVEGSLFYEGGRTALMYAATWGHLAVVRALLDAGAAIDVVADDGDTALTCAAGADANALAMVRLLQKRGARPARARWKRAGFTPLYRACAEENIALARHLLRGGAAVDAPIWTKDTPLMAAAKAGALDIVKLLLRAGASVTRRNGEGETALMLAVEEEHLDVVRVLIAAGASVRAKDKSGQSVLQRAVDLVDDPFELVQLLLAAGAPIEPADLLRATALHATAVVALLLERGADVESVDDEGLTPLMIAAKNGYADLVNLFLRAGADEQRKGPRGKTAAKLARESRRDEVLPLFARKEPLPPFDLAAHWLVELVERALDARPREQRRIYETVPRLLRESVFPITSNYAYALQQCGAHADAVRYFELAMRAQPKKANLPRAACFSHYAIDDWASMKRCAERAVELDRRDDYAWQQLAIAHAELGDHEQAIVAGKKALAIKPTNAYAMANLAKQLEEAGDASWSAMIQRAVQLAPDLRDDSDVAALLARVRSPA